MEPLRHDPDVDQRMHLEDARRLLVLPLEVNRLDWHPFGCYAVPLPKRTSGNEVWVRRLHVWHPQATPVGETSIYGVHTHSGTAKSHVLVGALQHHLYDFETDTEGVWIESSKEGNVPATLLAHAQAPTKAGVTHTLPANQPHGVSKPRGLEGAYAISLFEQREEGRSRPFTTWQRTDAPAEALVLQGPVEREVVLDEARALIEQALYAVQ